MVKVKICGITNLSDALGASRYGADVLGFIFSKKSPRYIKPQSAKKIISKLDPFVLKCGVFANQEKDEVLEIASLLELNILQFHGDESASFCKSFRRKFKIVKVFFPKDRPYHDAIAKYSVDGFLFDVKYQDKIKGQKTLCSDSYKEIAAIIKKNERVIISSGLTEKNINNCKNLNPYAIDVASGIEEFVGKKDHALMRIFIEKAKQL
ncbi:MAG: phosphoribosylanthranilate isomerase [Candidatus Omnitrophica bacterium]|nr:phosphoribosylanthranilate isomerase [Candidatus Omnitrophota bacterium]